MRHRISGALRIGGRRQSLAVAAVAATGLSLVSLLVLNASPTGKVSNAATSLAATKSAVVGVAVDNGMLKLDADKGTANSLSGVSTVSVVANNATGYTLTQGFVGSESGTADQSELTATGSPASSTAKWASNGELTLASSGAKGIPVTVSHRFGAALIDGATGSYSERNLFTYTIDADKVGAIPAGDYSVKATYTVLANPIAQPDDGGGMPNQPDKDDSKGTPAEEPDIKKVSATTQDGGRVTVTYDKNMIPIRYAGTPSGDVTPRWVVADPGRTTGDDAWFNYDNQQWANAVTVKADKLSTYKAAKPGTEVKNDDVLGYFVYIPRYAYEVQRRDATDRAVNAQNFAIHFESAETAKSVPKIGCSTLQGATLAAKDYRNECGIERRYHGGTMTDGVYDQTTWATHPAFTWGDTELDGFWIGKFETTGTITAPTVKPNQMANISHKIGEQFTSAASLGVDDATADKMGDAKLAVQHNSHNVAGVTSHMLKNSEWGAVAYLSASKYGAGVNNVKNNNVRNTNHSSDADGTAGSTNSGAATGCGPGSMTDDHYVAQAKGVALGTDKLEDDKVCETSSSDQTHAYNQPVGVLASTTNNVYGVYDMAGGVWEYVMGSRTRTPGKSATSSISRAVEPPYIDLYETGKGFKNRPTWAQSKEERLYNNDVCTWASCGGQALHETKRAQSVNGTDVSWGDDNSEFVYANYPWFRRGGYAKDTSNAGVFATKGSDGSAVNYYGFRVSLIAAER